MRNFESIIWGTILVVVGCILGLNAVGVTNIDIFFDGWWTLFIIIPSFIGLLKDSDKTGSIVGLVIGVALLLACQDVFSFDFIWKLALPVILIIIGLSIIFKNVLLKKTSEEIKKINKNGAKQNSCYATFSEQRVDYSNEKFTGANLTAVFGGVKCDLSKSIIEKDVVINAKSIFGGIEIYIPSNVSIKIKSTSVFGDVSNKTENDNVDNKHTIYVDGTAVFGEIKIKNGSI